MVAAERPPKQRSSGSVGYFEHIDSRRLTQAGVPREESPQSLVRVTAASSNLYELIERQNFVAYPDAAVRLATFRAVAIDTPRGSRITKTKAPIKIDVAVALAMALAPSPLRLMLTPLRATVAVWP